MIKQKYRILFNQSQTFLSNSGRSIVYRIEACKTFTLANCQVIKKGTLGGWVGGYHNLSQEGSCWIDEDALVTDNALVAEDAFITGRARVCEHTKVQGASCVKGNAWIRDYAHISGSSIVSDEVCVRNTTYLKNCVAYDYAVFTGEGFFENCSFSGYTSLRGTTSFKNQIFLESPIQLQLRQYWCYSHGLNSDRITIGIVTTTEEDFEKILSSKEEFEKSNLYNPDDYNIILKAFTFLRFGCNKSLDEIIKKN